MKLNFTEKDVIEASNEWGFNCGPGAFCAATGLTPEQAKPFFAKAGFMEKGYTNPSLMLWVLQDHGEKYKQIYRADEPCGMPALKNGLVRIQWGGRWTNPNVPMRVRQRHTHWIAMRDNGREVFDVNAMSVGGWVTLENWSTILVPWIIEQCVPNGDGTWWPTHGIEIANL